MSLDNPIYQSLSEQPVAEEWELSGPISSSPKPPKPHYAKGDTTAATKRIAELRENERLKLRVPRELLIPMDRLPVHLTSGRPMNMTAEICGDPLPGRSALDGFKPPWCWDDGETIKGRALRSRRRPAALKGATTAATKRIRELPTPMDRLPVHLTSGFPVSRTAELMGDPLPGRSALDGVVIPGHPPKLEYPTPSLPMIKFLERS